MKKIEIKLEDSGAFSQFGLQGTDLIRNVYIDGVLTWQAVSEKDVTMLMSLTSKAVVPITVTFNK